MASMAEISVSMDRLVDAMPPPRGVDAAKAFDAYCTALVKFTPDEIDEGIRRFLAGECDEKISLKFYPRPPELARIVGGVHAERTAETEKVRRAEQLAAERREMAEAEKLRVKTPGQKARAAELMAAFHAGEPVDPAQRHMPRSYDPTRPHHGPPPPTRITQPRDPVFVGNSRDPYRARTPAAKADDAAPLDPDLVAAVPDRPLPKGMAQIADAAPGVPAPGKTLDPVEALAFDDIGEFLKAKLL